MKHTLLVLVLLGVVLTTGCARSRPRKPPIAGIAVSGLQPPGQPSTYVVIQLLPGGEALIETSSLAGGHGGPVSQDGSWAVFEDGLAVTAGDHFLPDATAKMRVEPATPADGKDAAAE